MTKIRRMKRIFANDGKSITLALDGYHFSSKTEEIDKTISLMPALMKSGLDAVLVTYGMAKAYADAFGRLGMLIRADASTEIFDPSVPRTMASITVEDAVRLGADGIISMTFPGADNEAESHRIASVLAKDADQWNMPFMCETLPFGYAVTNEASNDPNVIAVAARIGTEFGADIIKTRFSGRAEDRAIVNAANCPVLALGGPKTKKIEDYFTYVKHCIDMGAKGVAAGRNIIQSENPVGVVAALNVLIHQEGSVEEAYQAYRVSF
ncbi:class I fructose-bisphosphate aldolase [Shouchella patagoniensis]|uniref:class I fructose-bisphosphate aldolase n=1 Tax=Shouchella patagoniensis TaxID=228576 RepID=UPI000995A072|nr:phospho-2-dehydro-3-deoxyheptonate aldolase [Shouchella patagoniensis]